MTAPITIPAICPPERPLPSDAASDAEGIAVPDVKRGGRWLTVGKSTPLQRPVTFELMQHESVELKVLVAQNVHSPTKFFPKPHSCGSLSCARMHVPDNESAGRAQLVKSARTCSMKPGRGVPQYWGLTAISSSLMAESAWKIALESVDHRHWVQRIPTHESAHSGVDCSLDKPQMSLEFCTMPLQSTLMVYRA